MSLRNLESAITYYARLAFQNKKLRVKDLQEWSSAQIAERPTESTLHLPEVGVYVAVLKEHDKRPEQAT